MRPTKGDASYRDSLIKHCASEANAPKRCLMELRDSLMSTPGCTKKAYQLDLIVARLEAWQNG